MKRYTKGDGSKGRSFRKTGTGSSSSGGRKTFRKEDKPEYDKKKTPFRSREKRDDKPAGKRTTSKPGWKEEGKGPGKKTTGRTWEKREDKPEGKRSFSKPGKREEFRSPRKKYDDGPKKRTEIRTWEKQEDKPFEKKSFAKPGKRDDFRGPKERFDDRPEKKTSFRSREKRDDKPEGKRSFSKPGQRDDFRGPKKRFDDRPEKKTSFRSREKQDDKPEGKRSFSKPGQRDEFRGSKKDFGDDTGKKTSAFESYLQNKRKPAGARPVKGKNTPGQKKEEGLIRLNKYISNAGICSRREADEYIQTGVVTVNGEVITELGHKIKPTDKVTFGGRQIRNEKPVYVLLNKPKDYITTSKDPQNRKTVMDLVADVKERVYPVGRLDRNTTGLLLLTNDGEMADKLMHPRKKVVKIYHVELDKKISTQDLQALSDGLTLDDGFFKPDVVSSVEGLDRHHVGVEIHSGRNRIVRRLFEHLGYDVVKLDRVFYAGLSKKGLPRGEWRFLKDEEVNMLKMIG